MLELCRYVVLNPLRAKAVMRSGDCFWSSYRATPGELPAQVWLAVDWVLGQFGQRQSSAQAKYCDFVPEGIGGPTPWEEVLGQIYLSSKEFVEQHQPDRMLAEIPRKQSQSKRPLLKDIFTRPGAVIRVGRFDARVDEMCISQRKPHRMRLRPIEQMSL